MSQISQENTCARVSFFIKIKTLTQVFSCEFCEISNKTFFTEHLLAAVSLGDCLFALDIDMFWSIILEDNSSNQAKWAAKLGILVKIYIFSWDNMVFL